MVRLSAITAERIDQRYTCDKFPSFNISYPFWGYGSYHGGMAMAKSATSQINTLDRKYTMDTSGRIPTHQPTGYYDTWIVFYFAGYI
jgi:hypothetical protein